MIPGAKGSIYTKNLLLPLFSLLFLTSCLPLVSNGTPPPTPDLLATPWDDRSIFKDGLSTSAQPVLDELEGASVYHIEFNIEDDLAHIAGTEEVRYTNTEGTALNEVHLRLFPNILGGEMQLSEISLDERTVTPNYGLNDSLMIVPFSKPLEPGQSIVLKMNFAISVPQAIDLNYGVQAYYDDVLAFAHAYPMIAVYDDEGWNAEIPPQSGDVTYADMSFFIVRVKALKQVTLVGSGREVSREETEDGQVVTYAAGPVRDFYLAASPSYEVFTRQAGEVTLRFYTRSSLQDGAQSALDYAQRAVGNFSTRYVPYPYTELDFVSTPTQALGIEYPGMIAITEWIVTPGDVYLEATVAHEVGHQWFYNLVGNDQLDDPWLDESLAQFITLEYFTDEYGSSGNAGFRQDLESRWESISRADIPVGLPVAEYSSQEYSAIVYGRGALFFVALREEIGTQAFDAFMKDYTETYAWHIATPQGLQQTAEEHCSCDLTSLFDEWIY